MCVVLESLRKYINFDDFMWVAPLFHAYIEEGSRFSVGGPRTTDKMHNYILMIWCGWPPHQIIKTDRLKLNGQRHVMHHFKA